MTIVSIVFAMQRFLCFEATTQQNDLRDFILKNKNGINLFEITISHLKRIDLVSMEFHMEQKVSYYK